MHCWHRLKLHYKDILQINKDSLCKKILENQSYNIGDPYVLFFIRSQEVFNSDFIEFLKSKDLVPMPFSVGFLADRHSKGFIHTDYYSGVSDEIAMDGVPYLDELTEEMGNLLKGNSNRYWHASLHLNLGSSGSLEWFSGTTTELFEKTKLKIPIYRYDNEEELTQIDKLMHNGISICRTDILHRSNNEDSTDKLRIAVTARFVGNPTFQELKEKLEDLVEER